MAISIGSSCRHPSSWMAPLHAPHFVACRNGVLSARVSAAGAVHPRSCVRSLIRRSVVVVLCASLFCCSARASRPTFLAPVPPLRLAAPQPNQQHGSDATHHIAVMHSGRTEEKAWCRSVDTQQASERASDKRRTRGHAAHRRRQRWRDSVMRRACDWRVHLAVHNTQVTTSSQEQHTHYTLAATQQRQRRQHTPLCRLAADSQCSLLPSFAPAPGS